MQLKGLFLFVWSSSGDLCVPVRLPVLQEHTADHVHRGKTHRCVRVCLLERWRLSLLHLDRRFLSSPQWRWFPAGEIHRHPPTELHSHQLRRQSDTRVSHRHGLGCCHGYAVAVVRLWLCVGVGPEGSNSAVSSEQTELTWVRFHTVINSNHPALGNRPLTLQIRQKQTDWPLMSL